MEMTVEELIEELQKLPNVMKKWPVKIYNDEYGTGANLVTIEQALDSSGNYIELGS